MRPLTILIVTLVLLVVVHPQARADDLREAGDLFQTLLPAIGLATTLILKDWQGTKEWTVSGISVLAFTQAAKFTVQKWRPDDSDPDSFPSGHSSSAWFGATFIDRRYGWKYGIPMYFAAATTSYSRVKANKHFTDDVFIGAAIAVITTYYMVTPYKNVDVTAEVGANHIGLRLTARF